MKKSKFTEAQIAFVLKQADEGTVVAEVSRKACLQKGFEACSSAPAGRRGSSVLEGVGQAACSGLTVDRALYTYRPKSDDQAALRKRIKEITETRVRYSYRRVHVLLRREGWAVNPKRIYRLYETCVRE